eukprot:TRINITY_DN4011_c1_g2_i2.p1 TRINITY_DN4011_c1_g2~~TRINITY_DN4011_c1_g2_i2.p1  ORF type:complete len:1447 (-),score=257.41 TRINITY_DN4011_c1_g2_i2:82-4422(-)
MTSKGAPKELMDRPEHKRCADCDALGPKWACVNFGIVICETCAGIHRGLGVHISVVKSTKIDTWKPEWIVTLRGIGNEISNAYYEYSLPPGRKYTANVMSSGGAHIDVDEGKKLEMWIRDKYEKKRYAQPGVEEPYKRLKNGENLKAGNSAARETAPDAGAAKPSSDTPLGHSKDERKHRKSKSKSRHKSDADADLAPYGDAAENFASLGEWAADVGSSKPRKHKHRDSSRPKHRKHSSGFSDGAGTSTGQMTSQPSAHSGVDWNAQLQMEYPDQSGWDVSHSQQQRHDEYIHQQQQQEQFHQHPQQQYSQQQQEQQQPQQYQQGSSWGMEQVQHAQQQQQMYPPDYQMAMNGSMQQHQDGVDRLHGVPQASACANVAQPPQFTFGCGSQPCAPSQAASLPGSSCASAVRMFPMEGPHVAERRSALVSIARLFRAPESVGVPRHTMLVRPSGFDLQTAEFDPAKALKRPRAPGKAHPFGSSSSVNHVSADSWYELAPPGTEPTPSSSSTMRIKEDKREPFGGRRSGGFNGSGVVANDGGRDALAGRTSSSSQEQLAKELRSVVGDTVRASFGQLQEELRILRNEVGTLRGEKEASEARWAQSVPSASPALASTLPSPSPKPREDYLFQSAPAPCVPASLGLQSAEMNANARLGPSSASGALVDLLTRVDAPSGGANETGAVPTWKLADIDAQTFARYAQLFQQTDSNLDGWVEGAEARKLFDRSSLPPTDLAHIWGLVDEACAGRLCLEGFVCALQLVSWRLAGGVLPAQLPTELASRVVAFATNSAENGHSAINSGDAQSAPTAPVLLPPSALRSFADGVSVPGAPSNFASQNPWVPDAGQLEMYCAVYKDAVPSESGLLGPEEARQILERSGLPNTELSHIWRLSDVDADGNLTLGEFVCAMHLSTVRQRGANLPDAVPPELSALCASLDVSGPSGACYGTYASTPEVAVPSSPWQIREDDLQAYRTLLQEVPRSMSDFISAEEAKPVLERSQLSPVELAQIWQLSDADCDGRLSLREFVCALHLAQVRRLGLISELPMTLPSELIASLDALPPHLADVHQSIDTNSQQPVFQDLPASVPPPGNVENFAQIAMTNEEVERYWTIFEGMRRPDAGNFLAAEDAKTVLERSQLPPAELGRIWQLSDLDCDGRLSPVEAFCAFHLVALRQRGIPLPPDPPLELVRQCEDVARRFASSNNNGVGGASDRGGAGRDGNCSMAAASPAVATADSGGRSGVGWAISANVLSKYRSIFAANALRQSDLMAPDEARELLARSQLPSDELSHVWRICDVNEDGALSFPEFACAMHLVALRRQGGALPSELPAELMESSGLRSSAGNAAAFSSNQSIWRIGEDELRKTRALFDSIVGSDGKVGVDAGKEVFERSGLPQEDLAHIWQLSDVDNDTALSFDEFACAMHLLARRRQGAPLPPELPYELAETMRGGARS